MTRSTSHKSGSERDTTETSSKSCSAKAPTESEGGTVRALALSSFHVHEHALTVPSASQTTSIRSVKLDSLALFFLFFWYMRRELSSLTIALGRAGIISSDWIHDAIKHSLRLRRLRRLKETEGVRGWLKNVWDSSQGWLLVTMIGSVTALIAFAVISAEMVLFDLKGGYCRPDWRLAKRFCCPALDAVGSSLSRDALSNTTSAPQRPLTTAGFVLAGWNHNARSTVLTKGGEECDAWRTWAQVWQDHTGQGSRAGAIFAYCAYVVLAVSLASRSSLSFFFRTRGGVASVRFADGPTTFRETIRSFSRRRRQL